MDNKNVNKEIRRISSYSSLPLLLELVLYTLLTLGVNTLLLSLFNSGISVDTGLFTLIVYVVLYLGFFPLSIFLFYKLRGKKTGQTLKACFKKPEKSAGWIAKWLVIAVGVTYLMSMLSGFIFNIIQNSTNLTLTSKDLHMPDSIFGILAIVLAIPIFAPIFEELLFRATLFRSNEPLGQWFAVIITGLMFGLWHLNYTQFLFAVSLGVFSSLLLIKTGSIIPSIIMHFFVNLIGTIQTLCLGNSDVNNISSNDEIYLLLHMLPSIIIGFLIFVIIAVGVALFIVELVRHRAKVKLNKCVYQIKPLKKLAVYFSAPITIILFAFMIVFTVLNAVGISIL